MKKSTLLLVVTILMFAVTANAAVQPSEREISLFGNYIHAPTKNFGSSDGPGLGVGVAEFISNEVSVGLQGWFNWGEDGYLGAAGVNGKYHFCPMDEVTPYVGGQLNYAYARNTGGGPHADGAMWGPLAGLRFSVADKTSLFVEYQWQLYCGEIRDILSESSAIVVGLAWGF